MAGLLCDRGWSPCGTAESDTKTCTTQSTDRRLVRPLQEAQQNQVMSMLDNQIRQVRQLCVILYTFRVKLLANAKFVLHGDVNQYFGH